MKILFVASEGVPYSKTGGLADVVGALSAALVEAGHQVAVLLPKYRGTKTQTVTIPSLTIPIGDELRFPSIVEGATVGGVRFYFLDDPDYFDRPQLYGEKGSDYHDNPERFCEFSRAAIEFTKRVWMPDVIHCHDWQTALVPVMLRALYARDPALKQMAVVFTIHNLGYQGLFPHSTLARIGLPETLFQVDALEFFGKVNFLKGGLIYSDRLTTVSKKYAAEIQTKEYGYGLEGVIRMRADRLTGILNGVDYSEWSPEADKLIVANYSAHNLDGKRACKKDLLGLFNLPVENMTRPVIGIVSRFVDQKGFDIFAEAAAELMQENLALVALGSGDPQYEKLFLALAQKFPSKLGAKIAYDNTIAHKIEAGADMFLMPSRYEPCGLNQIYSLRYGTVPIVRATGGLDDTIVQYNSKSGGGTGFKFEAYTGRALLESARTALRVFRDPAAWHAIQTAGMAKDFSWKASASAYVTVYEEARRGRIPMASVTSN
jgi:starch synthase